MSRPSVAQRFWTKVEFTHQCWNWTGAKSRGYGSFHDSESKRRLRAHRVAYRLLVGEVPSGMTLDHLCQNPACVNPSHLEPVTGRENTLRGNGICARNARKTHCKRGHEFTPENTYMSPKGRACRTCLRMLRRAWEPRRKKPTCSAEPRP